MTNKQQTQQMIEYLLLKRSVDSGGGGGRDVHAQSKIDLATNIEQLE